MNISIKFLVFSVSLLLFIGGLTYATILQKEISYAIQSMYKNRIEADKNLVAGSDIPPDYLVSGQEVLQSIYHIKDIDADIDVDGELFPKNLIIEETTVSHIDITKKYEPTYVRNTSGKLVKLIFNLQ